MSDQDTLVTITEIVDHYGVARKTVQRWVDAGKLVPVQTLPGRTGAHLFTREQAESAFGPHLRRRKAKEAKKAEAPA